MLDRFQSECVDAPLTLAIGPGALSVLRDAALMGDFDLWLKGRLAEAERDADRLAEDPLWPAAAARAAKVLEALEAGEGAASEILRTLLKHCEARRLSLIPIAGTAPLPLLATEGFRWAHIKGAASELEALTGRKAAGALLPGGAWAPDLSALLRRAGFRYTILEASALERGSAQRVTGPFVPVLTPDGLACFGAQVLEGGALGWEGAESKYLSLAAGQEPMDDWSLVHDEGRMGDARFLCTANEEAGLYDPEAARQLAQEMGHGFIARLSEKMGDTPQGAAVFTWPAQALARWFEGWAFFEGLLRASVKVFEVGSPDLLLDAKPRCQVLVPDQSSMMEGGLFGAWLDPAADWVYRHTRPMERELVRLARERSQSRGLRSRAVLAASRSLVLAQSSHWVELILSGAHTKDGIEGVERHLFMVGQLVAQIAEGRPEDALIETIETGLGSFLRQDLLGDLRFGV
jgi:1,4-alpha-glucan branching enzyme